MAQRRSGRTASGPTREAGPRIPAQMKDVAAHAGVSITTVSHIINDTRDVAPATRERVLTAMRELNYYKNAFGRRLARGRSDSFGLIISDIENPFFAELIKSYERSVMAVGCDTLLFSTDYDPERAEKVVRRMIENKVQGVAVMTSQLEPALVDELIAADIPVVRLDSGPARRGLSNLRVDYSAGAREAAAHLKQLGHRKISFITGPQNRVSAMTYKAAFLEALEQLGLPAAQLHEGSNTIDGGSEAVREMTRSGAEPPTAILCGNDMTAIGTIRALIELGFRVPDDVSVIGADDISYARFGNPALTTIRVPRDRLGILAYEALARMLKSKRRMGMEYWLETSLVVRGSTGPARSGKLQTQQTHAAV